ncbi:MAG: DUF190 domain-containing protein [Mycobacterium sp.]|nr:DUF190 domain-containing protein [Mycobacterium sp.]
MNDDISLKLTAYFAERERSGSRFLAEAMFDLFAQRRVATSVMLRGISGFGHGRVIRTDESLTLSDDPSVAIIAGDSPERIGDLAPEVITMTTGGLITLERARLLSERTFVKLPDGEDSVKLTVYVGRNRRIDGVPAYKAVCDLLRNNGFDGAWAFLGVDGTAHGERHRAYFIARNADVPVMIIAVGRAGQAQRCVAELSAVLDRPLLTVERVGLCKHHGRLLERPAALPSTDSQGRPLWQKLMVFTSESDRREGVPIHRAVVRKLWESRAASGVTVLRGVWGFEGDREPHGDKFFQFGRQVPVMTVVVDTPERIAASFGIIDELTEQRGLVTSEMVPARIGIDAGQPDGDISLADYHY